jgi:hypothetical protein
VDRNEEKEEDMSSDKNTSEKGYRAVDEYL